MSIQAITYVFERSKTTLADRHVLLSIANHADKYGEEAWPGLSMIAEETGVNEKTVRRCLARLTEVGEIECTGERKNRHGRPTRIWRMPQIAKPDNLPSYENADNWTNSTAKLDKSDRITGQIRPVSDLSPHTPLSRTVSKPSINRPINVGQGAPQGLEESVIEVMDYFNAESGRSFKADGGQASDMRARLRDDGASVEDLKLIVDFKIAEWTGTEMERHLIPGTIFRRKHFEPYLSSAKRWHGKGRPKMGGSEGDGRPSESIADGVSRRMKGVLGIGEEQN